MLHDISRDGRILLTRNSIKRSIICQPPGESTERELTWLGGSIIRDLSANGQMLVFEETLFGRLRLPVIFQRATSGTPARSGSAKAILQALSPDGRWALALADNAFTLLPTGAGAARVLDKGALARWERGRWLPDSTQIVFAGWEAGEPTRARIFLQAIDGGAPRAITTDDVSVFPEIALPDGRAIVGFRGEEREARLSD